MGGEKLPAQQPWQQLEKALPRFSSFATVLGRRLWALTALYERCTVGANAL